MIFPAKRIGAVLAAATAVVAAAPAALAVAPAPVSVGSPGVLSKTAVDAAGQPISSAHPGDTVNWVATLPQSAGAVSALSLTDTIEAPQTYVPGSLVVPPGLTGTEQNGTISVSGDVNPTGTATVAPIPPPATTFATPKTGGDGYTPILFGVNVFNLFHDFNGSGVNTAFINCFDKATGAQCSNYPTYLSTQNAGRNAFGVGADDFVTARQNSGYLDRSTGRYYVAGANLTKDIGVLCLDLTTRTGCGWTPIQPGYGFDGSGTASYPYVQNGAFAHGKFYAVTRSGRLICVVTATMAPCPGQGAGPDFGFNIGLPNQGPAGTFPSWGSTIRMIGAQVIVTVPTSNPAGNVRISCLDPATDATCTGTYPRGLPGSTASNFASGGLPTLSPTSAVTGYCININNGSNDAGTTISWHCFDLTGADAPNPPGFNLLTFGYSKQGLAEFTTYGTRVYYPS